MCKIESGKRGTVKEYCGYDIIGRTSNKAYGTDEEFNQVFACLDKLGRLEDIEEELGFDLITLFKALQNGIYGKVGKEIKHISAPHFSWFKKEIYIFRLADYGKTWALTEEELE